MRAAQARRMNVFLASDMSKIHYWPAGTPVGCSVCGWEGVLREGVDIEEGHETVGFDALPACPKCGFDTLIAAPTEEYDNRSARARLRALIEKRALIRDGVFRKLSSGGQSDLYFDLRKVALTGEGLNLITTEVLSLISELPDAPRAVGGPASAAVPIVSAIVQHAYQYGVNLTDGVITTSDEAYNCPRARTSVVIVDDVITSGGSLRRSGRILQGRGLCVVAVLAVIDREEGGVQGLERQFQCPVRTIFKASDFEVTA